MKVSYVESLASSYGLHRRCKSGNAIVLSVRQGGKRRPAIELRNLNFHVPTWSLYGEGNITATALARLSWTWRSLWNLCMRGNLNRENREIRRATGREQIRTGTGSEPFSGKGCHER